MVSFQIGHACSLSWWMVSFAASAVFFLAKQYTQKEAHENENKKKTVNIVKTRQK